MGRDDPDELHTVADDEQPLSREEAAVAVKPCTATLPTNQTRTITVTPSAVTTGRRPNRRLPAQRKRNNPLT